MKKKILFFIAVIGFAIFFGIKEVHPAFFAESDISPTEVLGYGLIGLVAYMLKWANDADISPENQPNTREGHLIRTVSKDLLHKDPTGTMVFGRSEGKYVGVVPGKRGATHCLVVAGSGTGKTSGPLICTTLADARKKSLTFLMIDVKGEIREKGFSATDEKIAVFNPQKRDQYGFDFLFDIHDDSSESDVVMTLRRVVYSLVPKKAESKDTFWADGSRSILLGLFLYAWQHDNVRNIPDMVDFVLSDNLKTLINRVLGDVDERSIIAKALTPYGGEDAAEETISSLSMNIGTNLQLMATDETLRYLLRDCGKTRMITPDFLEKGISIDIQIADEYLNIYSKILSLTIGTCLTALTRRPESSSPIVVIIDELGRICREGPIQGLQEVLQIGRSRGVSVMCLLQSWAAMEGPYSKAECQDMLNNFGYRLLMQAQPDDKVTTEMAIKAFGKYLEKKRSINRGKSGSSNYSFEEKDILRETDLLELPTKNRVILLSPYGAYTLQKCQYFKDIYFKNIFNQIHKSGEGGMSLRSDGNDK